jgi:hypothetical protein
VSGQILEDQLRAEEASSPGTAEDDAEFVPLVRAEVKCVDGVR